MKRLVQIVFFGLLLTLLAAPVFGSEPRRFYDWSATVETRQASQVLGASVLAATVSATPGVSPVDPNKYSRFNRYLFAGNVTPDNFFHFLKVAQENFQLTLTFDARAKEETRLAIAGERLSEMQNLARRGTSAGMETAARGYDQTMAVVVTDLAKLKKENKAPLDELLNRVEEETAKHNVLLEEVVAKAPPPAKKVLARAVEASEEGNDTVADLTGRPAIPPDLVDRITALKSQGLLTSEEAVKLISLKTRTEARGELRKYAQEGVLPEADLLRMNETAKSLFPQEFYKIHEIKRFYELKRLETEKPPDETLKKIQDFAKTYKPGEVVPADLRRYWAPVVRKEELDNTIRPDFVPPDLFKFNPEDEKKFNEIVERYRPRPEDVAFLNSLLAKNPALGNNLPPEYERMKGIARTYGAQCGAGMKWFEQQVGGYCAPENTNGADLPKTEDFAQGKVCYGAIISAKGPNGVCSAFPLDCLPAGWVRMESCAEGPRDFATGAQPGMGVKRIECPINSHFVAVYSENNGYCMPNYTPTAISGDTSCPARYHRSYAGGPCLSDDAYYTTAEGQRTYIAPLTTTPGAYPSPFYPPSSACGPGYNWVPEPVNPRGGYCAPQSYQPGGGVVPIGGANAGNCTPPPACLFTEPRCLLPTPPNGWCPAGSYGGSQSRESQEATCRGGGGTCEWNNNICNCKGYTPPGGNAGCTPPATTNPCPSGQRYSYSTCKCEASTTGCSQKWNCPSGMTWNDNTCDCRTASGDWRPVPSSCQMPSGGCGSGSYWDYSSCSCRGSGSYPTACAEPSVPCPAGRYWDRGTCTCAVSCGAGSAWNGSACMPNSNYSNPSPSRESQEATCRAGGGTCVSWVNNACGCERPGGAVYYPPTPSSTTPTNCQPPSTTCPSNQYFDWGSCSCRSSGTNYSGLGGSSSCQMPSGGCGANSWWDYGSCSCRTSSSTPPSSGGSGSYGSCPSGQYWNGSNCVSSTPAPSPAPNPSSNPTPTPTPTPTPSPAPAPEPAPSAPAPAPAPAPTEPAPSTGTTQGVASERNFFQVLLDFFLHRQ